MGEPSRAVIFPKYRADLVACAGITEAMHEGAVEATRYPRNPLDVLAQQIVAMVSMESWGVEDLFAVLRRAAPFAELSRSIFDGVLDMLSGRYPSDEFAELRPRITWDRVNARLEAREGARRVAITNGGTIPDRGLYGVFLAGAAGQARGGRARRGDGLREPKVGETFLLGASTWRIEEITHDRVLVSPAPGEPGKMPFWHGDAAGRSLELGRRIGRLVRELRQGPRTQPSRVSSATTAWMRSRRSTCSDTWQTSTRPRAPCPTIVPSWSSASATSSATGASASSRRSAGASTRPGRWRRRRRSGRRRASTPWRCGPTTVSYSASRIPMHRRRWRCSCPRPQRSRRWCCGQLGGTALFAAKFREVAARALLLPRRRPGQRAPLWQQRKRAADLLAVAAQYGSFPMLLETYRECLREVFDLPALRGVLAGIAAHEIRVETSDPATPSPFAAAILFGFVANYIYDGDAPLAERRAQALAIDQAQLRELLGDAELRELLDAGALAELERELQRLDESGRASSVDAVHDLLLRLGDLSPDELRARIAPGVAEAAVETLQSARRAVPIDLRGERRFVAVEHASRYRDALGVALPPGIPEAFLASVPDALGDLVLRHARTHGPFTGEDVAARYELARSRVDEVLRRLTGEGRLVEGAFRPGGQHREWCDPDVLQRLRRRSLAKLRREVEPVEPHILARFACAWHGVTRRARGLDALLDAIERLQGAALPASILESEILPARVEGYAPSDLDALAAAGEVVWCGVEPLAEHDGRIALYLADALPKLYRPVEIVADLTLRETRLVEVLAGQGASFFDAAHHAAGGGFPRETADALWSLVWRGLVTNDTFQALRAHTEPAAVRQERRRQRHLALRPDAPFARVACCRRRPRDAGPSSLRACCRSRAPPNVRLRWRSSSSRGTASSRDRSLPRKESRVASARCTRC